MFNKKKRTTVTWVDLKHIMLNERNQKQKSGYCMTPFIRKSKNRRNGTDDEQGCLGAGGWCGETGKKIHGSFWSDRIVLNLDGM